MNQERIAKPEKPVKHTKVLDRILKRYDVVLREKNSTIAHALTGRKCELDPLTFAVYEACTKAVYLSNAVHPSWQEAVAAGHDRHYHNIARKDGFTLPNPEVVAQEDREKVGMQAADDYKSCARILTEVGMYFYLLD